jgi:hypothetical protein
MKSLLAMVFMASAGTALADNFSIEPFTIKAGEEKTVTLHLNGSRKYIGFQVDIYMPQGISIKQDADGLYLDVVAAMTNNRNGHTAEGNLNGDHYTIIVDHPRNGEFQSESGDVLDITLVANDQISTGEQVITLKHQVLNDAAINEYRFDDTDLAFTTMIDVVVKDLGYATFSWPRDLDFAGTGLTAYIATEADDYLTLQAVEKVPAGTGIVLKGQAGTYNPQTIDADATMTTIVVNGSTVDIATANLLTGTPTSTFSVVGTNTYVLSKNSEGKAGFLPAAEGLQIPQYKAFLTLTDGQARSFIGFAEDSTTGISLTPAFSHAADEWYSPDGRRLAGKPTHKGIYLNKGRKVVVK